MTLEQRMGESTRNLAGWILALLLVLPALVILTTDRITMAFLRRHGEQS